MYFQTGINGIYILRSYNYIIHFEENCKVRYFFLNYMLLSWARYLIKYQNKETF